MKKIMCIITISLIIVSIIILSKNEYGRKLYKNANFGIEALIKKGEIENLFIGSSMFRQGLDIYALEKTIGSDSYILAYSGNQPAFELLELEYLLKNGVKIKNLYMDMYVYTLYANPNINDTRILAQTNTKFKIDIWDMLKKNCKPDLSVFWEMFVTSNNEAFLSFPISYKLTNNLYHKGGNTQKNTGLTLEQFAHLEVPSTTNDKPCDYQLNALIKIIELCKQNEINLIFLETPKWYKVCENKRYQDMMKEYISILDKNDVNFSLSSKTAECLNYINCNIIDFDSENPQFFLDMVHMSSDGREEYGLKL